MRAGAAASQAPVISALRLISALRRIETYAGERPARQVHLPEMGHRHDQALLSEVPQRPVTVA